jgi:lycopene beta-cyclase
MSRFDYVLVGGGLQSGLIALALRRNQPDATIALVERNERLGGNHTWCFHEGDVPSGTRDWLDPLVQYRWDGYRVQFPGEQHTIAEPYAGVSSARLHEIVSDALRGHPESELRLGTEVVRIEADRVELEGGETVQGTVVVDARGPSPIEANVRAGYQKFFGLEVELSEGHGLDLPVVMDATVDQSDGYRFMYLLPFDERRVLVEDTYFHDTPVLDPASLEKGIRAYIEEHGWSVSSVVRREKGVLPMPWSGHPPPPGRGPLAAGYRGGWFHPGTGYSFPVALRLAEFIAARSPNDLYGRELDRLARAHRGQARFSRFLNRLLFRWYPPANRRSIFERVYRLPPETVRAFYALRLGWRDRARLLIGRPPKGLSIRHRLRPPRPS